MSFEQIINDLKNKKYSPIYLLTGEEPYYIDLISDFIEDQVLTDEEKEFNQNVLYGRDVDTATIVSLAKQYPLMSNWQVLIIKEAQELRTLDGLQSYVENPLKSTILVLCYKYKKIDKRKSLVIRIKKNGVFFESQKLYENRIPEWIRSYLQDKGYTISPKASILLLEYLGTDLEKIVNEIGKLIINIPQKREITEEDIEVNIGISKEYNVFELQKAIGKRDVRKVNMIINYFAANEKENPLVKVLAILSGFFIKTMIYHQLKDKSQKGAASALSIHPFFVQDYQVAARNYSMKKLGAIVSYLREYDLKSKGVDNVSVKDGELMKELMFKILH